MEKIYHPKSRIERVRCHAPDLWRPPSDREHLRTPEPVLGDGGWVARPPEGSTSHAEYLDDFGAFNPVGIDPVPFIIASGKDDPQDAIPVEIEDPDNPVFQPGR